MRHDDQIGVGAGIVRGREQRGDRLHRFVGIDGCKTLRRFSARIVALFDIVGRGAFDEVEAGVRDLFQS